MPISVLLSDSGKESKVFETPAGIRHSGAGHGFV